ncbi:MAG: RluA family pseudouridine synthase [Firmicutes bacterium]|nr:RluA family pseudouridine synthase [Bacillota bacterium]
MREIIINENDAAQRLDKFITKYMPKLPKSMLYKGLRKNCVRVNGAHVKDGAYMLRGGDKVSLYFKDEFFDAPEVFAPVPFDSLKIIYEDENILLIDKRAGELVHADENQSGASLIDKVKSYLSGKGEYSPSSEHSFSPAFCNRLDRNTAGIIIAAKNAAALRCMNEKIRGREIDKFYLCVVEGVLTGAGTIEGYLARGDKKVTVSDTPSSGAKFVKTDYTAVADNGKETLVEAKLLTGRTHQIRASFAHIGHPLCGDRKYGSSSRGTYRLYSYKLRFSFDKNGSVLDYLSGMEFTADTGFAKKFLSQNS